MYNVLLWLHILAAAVWFGAGAANIWWTPRLSAASESGGAFALGFVEMGRKVFTPAAVVALATGIGLVIGGDSYEFSAGFISIGFLMVIVGGALGGAVYGKTGRAIAAAHDGGEPTTALYARLRTVNLVELALLAFTIYAMTVKLGA